MLVRRSFKDVNAALLIDESLKNGLLTGENQLYFMHQAVHEHFVARRLKASISSVNTSEKRAITSLRAYSSSVSLARRLRKWAKEDWWAEVIVQLAGISEQPEFVAKHVLRSNPWLAYWCSIEGRSLNINTRAQIQRRTVERLDSQKGEERLRVVRELARMENPRTINYLIIALRDSSTPLTKVHGGQSQELWG
jgi:hypothetical protein